MMIVVDDTIARLKALDPPPFAAVLGAAQLAQILKSGVPTALPAAYVYITEEASAPNERITGCLQRTEIDLAVLIIAGSVADPRGQAAAASIDALKHAVRQSLCGWQPPSAEDLVTHVGGKFAGTRDGTVWFEDTYATAVYTPEEP